MINSKSLYALFLLRSAYNFMAVFNAGVLAIFGVQIIMFLFLVMAIEAGLTSKQERFDIFLFFWNFIYHSQFPVWITQCDGHCDGVR